MATVSNYASHAPTTSTSKTQIVINVLHWTYGLLPIAAGADKFLHLLTDWNQYLAPVVSRVLPVSTFTFMAIVGVVEILAGIIVLARPKIGSLIVGCWLIGIAINLVLTGQYFDIAVRDMVIAIGAICLYTLLSDHHKH